jgi:hypothetical protein
MILIGITFILLGILGVAGFFTAALGERDSIPAGLFMLLICAFGFLCFCAGKEYIRRDAVINGAAEYKQIVQNGDVSNDFVWKKSN